MNYIGSILMGCYARIQYVYYFDGLLCSFSIHPRFYGLLCSYSLHLLFRWAVMLIFNTCTISMGCYAHIHYMYQLFYSCYVLLMCSILWGLLIILSVGAVMLSVGYCVLHQTVCYPSAVSCDLSVGAVMLLVGYCVLHQTVCYPSAVSCDLSVGAVMLSVGYCVLHQTVCYPSAVSCDLSVGAVMLSVGYCVLHQTVCYPSAVSCDLSVGAAMLSILCHTCT